MPFQNPLANSSLLLDIPEYESDEMVHRMLHELINNSSYGLKTLYKDSTGIDFTKVGILHSDKLEDIVNNETYTSYITYGLDRGGFNSKDEETKTKSTKQWHRQYLIYVSKIVESEVDKQVVHRNAETLRSMLSASPNNFYDILEKPTYSGRTYKISMIQTKATIVSEIPEQINSTNLYSSILRCIFYFSA